MTATRKQDVGEKRIFRRDEPRRYKALSNKKDGARPVSTLHYRVLQTGHAPSLHGAVLGLGNGFGRMER